jgi:hypothetical protein
MRYPQPPPRPEMPKPQPPKPELPTHEVVAQLLPPVEDPVSPLTVREVARLPDPESKPEEPVVGALRCYMEHKPQEGGALLDSYDRPTREALQCLLPLAVRFSQGRTTGQGAEEVPELVDRLHGITEPLRRKEALRIDKLTFCRQILRFGAYEPLPDGRPSFSAGCESRPGGLMLVYAEVSNFVCQPQPPLHVTKLASSAEIRDRQQQKVWSFDFGTKEDMSRTTRHDYFITYRFCVPPELKPGDYTLWIEVTDTQSRPLRTARRSLDFSVVAGGTAPMARGEMSLKLPAAHTGSGQGDE